MLYIDPLDRVTMNILTSFPFTFKLAVPGLSNPFTSLSTSPTTGTNPPRMPPSSAPRQRDFCQEHEERPSRSLARPTRPLPMSIGSNPMLGTSLYRPNPNPSFSPSPSPTPSAGLSLTHTYGSHLAPQQQQQSQYLSPYQQWQLQQQQQQNQAQTTSQRFSSSPAPLSRKRGWVPSNSSPSGSQTTLASTSGYLDPPAKLRDMAERMEVVHVDEARELDLDDLPPTKRRRGLAGSIVETAWSAALLGTAVGLSVYRLWRGQPGAECDISSQQQSATPSRKRRAARSTSRDDDDHMVMSIDSCPPSPPPPYNHEWTAVDYPRSIPITPSRRAGKTKATTPRATAARKMGPARRNQHTKVTLSSTLAGPSRHPPTADPAFDFSFGEGSAGRPTSHVQREEVMAEDVGVEDQMDWLGGKLAQLIEEGKKALKTEVVVMSETREDEVDDGSGAWVSDEEEERRTKHRRRGSTASARYNRRGTPQPSGSQVHTPEPSARKPQTSRPGSVFEGAGGDLCESPEVREMMERARAKFGARPSMGR